MVRQFLALSLLGLSAVTALPTNTVEERQAFTIGGGEGGGFVGGSSDCQLSDPSAQGSCVFTPLTGGFNPPRLAKRDDANKAQLLKLQNDLVTLQNKPNKTAADNRKIKELQKKIEKLAGIISISAPDGGSVTFTPGKRDDANKERLKELEDDLVQLQNKPYKTAADNRKIKELQYKIKKLAGIISISAPDGSSTTFTPGKRDSITFEPVGAFTDECPKDVSGVQRALSKLLKVSKPSVSEFLAIQRLTHLLAGCGYAISDDGATFFKIGKRGLPTTELTIVSGLQQAYTDALRALNGAKPSLTTWLALQSVADQLEYYGVTVDRAAGFGTAALVPRQFTLGCSPTDVISLTTIWNALANSFGKDVRKWPRDIYWQFYSVIQTLRTCGVDVGSMNPNPTVPGGSITPDPTYPGGSLKPDPTSSGGALKPDPYSSAAMLEALEALEDAYGKDASKVPAAVRPTMDTIVADLRGQGVVVIGWPSSSFGISP
ncbi:hypothetical protein QBC47DRAFT_292985 [Echria macrotheca]|uniref:Secreted protein n=1 Tax=Echria macrotheca TaxID=438768 RepID=A0AAJ0FEV5_9PEZI|nr:hypothetical protein QBC47DRAFT_292985 [Echria macrotheca]